MTAIRTDAKGTDLKVQALAIAFERVLGGAVEGLERGGQEEPAMDPIVTRRPALRARIAGRTARTSLWTPKKLV